MVEKIQLSVAAHFQSLEQQQAEVPPSEEVEEQPGEAADLQSEEAGAQDGPASGDYSEGETAEQQAAAAPGEDSPAQVEAAAEEDPAPDAAESPNTDKDQKEKSAEE
jgi:hypothetical protein